MDLSLWTPLPTLQVPVCLEKHIVVRNISVRRMKKQLYIESVKINAHQIRIIKT